ncbi:uncharacterized protein LOC142352877 [Convolutriloba macropyga]|uniref:uncharacterized protein LOC142352877 n=1 Tax=Convolutriloba macropyga TaxID=536237 RepID=UPI003F528BF7
MDLFCTSFFVTKFLVTAFFFSELVFGSLESGVLAVHNEHRSNAGLGTLTWDANLAAEAQSYTDTLTSGSCSLVHSTSSDTTMNQGENLFMVGADTYSDLDLGNMSSRAWYSEIALYKFPDDPSQVWDFCVDWTQVGHFSQMMWFNTALIGCGSGTCNGNTIVTCHYVPRGNYPTPMFGLTNYNQLIASGEVMPRCSSGATTG